MIDNEQKNELLEQTLALARENGAIIENRRCRRAVEDEPENDGSAYVNHYLYRMIVQHVKDNILARIGEV